MTKFLLFLFLYTITTVDATLKCTYITDNNVMDCVNYPPVTHCLKYILFDGLVQYTRTCDYNNICGSIGNTCVYNQSFPNIGLTRKLCCCDTDNCNAPEPQSNWRRCMNNVNLQHNDQEKICADGNDFCMTLSNSGNDVRDCALGEACFGNGCRNNITIDSLTFDKICCCNTNDCNKKGRNNGSKVSNSSILKFSLMMLIMFFGY